MGAVIEGRWHYCERADPVRDLGLLTNLLGDADNAWRLRYRGIAPTEAQVRDDLFGDDLLIQWIVRSRATDVFRGWVYVGSANFVDGHAFVSIASTAHLRGWGTFLEAAARCIDAVFLAFPLRKLYAEVLTETLDDYFGSGAQRHFRVEGIRRGNRYIQGTYRDVALLVIDRDEWAQHRGMGRAQSRPTQAIEAG